jgi:hypothetical protein
MMREAIVTVARMQRSAIRVLAHTAAVDPDCASLHPGYSEASPAGAR